MCGQPVDRLPLHTSGFSGSWPGIGVGLLIISVIVISVLRYQASVGQTAQAAQPTSPPVTNTPTITPTSTATGTPTTTATPTPTVTPTPRVHIVESGENPSYIADLYGVSVDELIALNNLDDGTGLSVGQAITLPFSAAEGEPDEIGEIVDYLDPRLQVVYEVESGDTLLDIAIKHGTTTEAIEAVNPALGSDLIYPGQRLVVPLATPTATATPTITPTPTPTPGPPYPPPNLLTPADEQVVDDTILLFNWTATGILNEDQFYVLQLVWADGTYSEYWGQQTDWRIEKVGRPAAGPVTWRVAIMRQTGVKPDGSPRGVIVTEPIEQRTVIWP